MLRLSGCENFSGPSRNELQNCFRQNRNKTLKLDSAERVIIPAVVRILIPSRIIQQYICYCKQEQFQPASERSLYRILDVCSASVQKSLQGLDNVTAEGTEAIDNLTKMIETLVENGAEEGWGTTTEYKVKEEVLQN